MSGQKPSGRVCAIFNNLCAPQFLFFALLSPIPASAGAQIAGKCAEQSGVSHILFCQPKRPGEQGNTAVQREGFFALKSSEKFGKFTKRRVFEPKNVKILGLRACSAGHSRIRKLAPLSDSAEPVSDLAEP